ncbi:MAG: hypothetical protein JO222_02685 [Frankiales bacterium]|nr:hypothetical protein [Frankiales bacterium]
MTVGAGPAGRCAAHPDRLLADSCPTCGRGRCAADRAAYGDGGCAVCRGRSQAPPTPAGAHNIGVRAGSAALLTAYPTAWVGAEYVNVHFMSLAWPVVGGLAASWAASTAAGRRSRREQLLVLLAAVAAALLGTALAFRLFGAPVTPVHPLRQVWLPYLTALVGVAIWPVLFPPPRPAPVESPDW